MKKFPLTLSILFFFLFTNAIGQQYTGLIKLDDNKINLYYSAGHEQRAKQIADRSANAIQFNTELLGFKPDVVLLVLDAEDWKKHTNFPVYGMPHFKNDNKTLIIASSDNDFWRSFIPPVHQLPAPLTDQVKKAYGKPDGSLSMQPFFDLLALHELGHAFHIQGGLNMQRKWMGELFANVQLHTYIAEKEPRQLPALTVFPQMVVSSGTTGFSFTTLGELEENYNLIAQQHPKNYGWYQSRWHLAAHTIYEAGGKEVLIKLWDNLKQNQTKLNDAEFSSMLHNKVHPAVANVMLQW